MENNTSSTNKFAIPLAIIIAGLIIGGSIYLSSNKKSPVSNVNNPTPTQQGVEAMIPVDESDHILGKLTADIIIVEYSDIECPFCKQFHTTLQRIIAEYGPSGKVAWVYRHFPIDSLHKNARIEAEATECAAELGGNGKFWEYTNILYERTKSNDGLDLTQLPLIAEEIGLNKEEFNECLVSRRHQDIVQKDYENAVASGGRGTPHSILVITSTGERIPIQGALPYENIKQAIDGILSSTN